MKTRTFVAIVGTACLLELGILAVAFREPLTEHGGGIPYLQPPTLDVELLDAPAPIILNGCFKSLIRNPSRPVAPCAEAPREAAGEPIPAAPMPSYAAPPVYFQPGDPAQGSYIPVAPVVVPIGGGGTAPSTPLREIPHGGGFLDRQPPCYRSETHCEGRVVAAPELHWNDPAPYALIAGTLLIVAGRRKV
jgi:hypothetical protein